MTSFWSSGSGAEITGKQEDAYLPDFDDPIPNGTLAHAKIVSFGLHEEIRKFDGAEVKEYRIVWKLTDGAFKGREVTQKIKPFIGEPTAIDRNLNALKLLMTLCDYKPKHANAPTNQDLSVMVGKECGIKIREWQMQKADSTMMEGNFVSETHSLKDFVAETGIKMQPRSPSSPSSPSSQGSRELTALDRNQRPTGADDISDLNDDIPF